MIDHNKLTFGDIGKIVTYTDGIGAKVFGRIKSWNDRWVFVVYKCDGDWVHFLQYTAAATRPIDLEFTDTKKQDPDITRFDLIDFD